jgi:hypothetical protein
MEAEKAKKTRRKETGKSGTARRTVRRSKGRKTIAEKETTTKQVIRVKDINELVNYCERFFNRKPFEGASKTLRLLKGEKYHKRIGGCAE